MAAIRLMAALFGLLTLCGLAQAEEPYLLRKDAYQIFVIGDAFAAGLTQGMIRMAGDDARLAIDGRYKEDSGLARPEFYDWPPAIGKIAESNSLDIAVVLVGSNDSREIRNGDFRYSFGSNEWRSAYAAQIVRMTDSLKKAGAAIYWVQLPAMQAKEDDEPIKIINEIQRKQVSEQGLRYIATDALFRAGDGSYLDKGPDETGAVRRLRDPDGVHLQRSGNNVLANLVLKQIFEDIRNAGTPEVSTQLKGDSLLPLAGPVFGQGAEAGKGSMMMPLPLAPPKPAVLDLTIPQILAQIVPSGIADQLFRNGVVTAPPPGRFDDFRMPPQ